MGKILIIGVGSAGVNTVKHMREVGIPNAEYITMGDFEDKVSVIPHYNLIEMSGLESLHSGATAENCLDMDWKILLTGSSERKLSPDGNSALCRSG